MTFVFTLSTKLNEGEFFFLIFFFVVAIIPPVDRRAPVPALDFNEIVPEFFNILFIFDQI